MLSHLRWILLGLLVFVPGEPGRGEGTAPTLRVGLLQHQAQVAFSGPMGLSVHANGGGAPVPISPGETWTVRVAEDRLQLTGPTGASSELTGRGLRLLPPEGGDITVHDVPGHWDKRTARDYWGAVEIVVGNGELTVVNEVDIETYLRGVVASEMPATYPPAALQAQAVAARGQALVKAGRHRNDGFDLCAGQHCQVYGGATSEDPRTDEAVASTRGEVLVYAGRLADTLYASTCGGHTANNEDYWPALPAVPYLRGTPDFEPEDGLHLSFPLSPQEAGEYLRYAPLVNCNRPQYAKTEKIRWWSLVRREQVEQTLTAALGDFGSLLGLRITDRAPSGLVREIAVVGAGRLVKVRGGSEIRRALGGLNSASLEIETIADREGMPVAFAIWGAGWGHQVGMCQVGAAGLADRGRGYRQILSKYYHGCDVERRY